MSWLAQAETGGGARVVRVLHHPRPGAHVLQLERLTAVPPNSRAAEDFGRALARTHRAGASAFGVGPAGWSGSGLFGPADDLREMPLREEHAWGVFYAEERLTVAVRQAGPVFDSGDRQVFGRLAERLGQGELDQPDEPASRIHGDLWSGNLMWTGSGCVVIDPAAHGGHRESDLAMLALFGAPHLERIIAAYDEQWPLASGWRDRVGLHQLYPVLMHAVLFGGPYIAGSVQLAKRYA